MTPQELKNSILQMAIQGKLVEQRPEEGTAEDLYQQMQAEKQKLIKEKKIKKSKSLTKIEECEILFEIPHTWKWIKLGELTAVVTKGTTPRGGNVSYLEKGVGFLRAENVAGFDRLDTSSLKYVDAETHNGYLKRSIIEANDILITIAGTLGRTGLVRKNDLPLNANQAVSIVRLFNPDAFDLNYLIYAINAPEIQRYLTAQRKITAIPNLTLEIIENCVIPIPPLVEQKRIVAKIEELLPLIDRYEAAWSRLEAFNKRFPEDMQKSILQEAIQGKLVEQRPEEGTGEELYQQIQVEKQKLIKEKKIKKDKPLPEITDDEKPFDIPESWIWIRMGHCGSWGSGATPARTHPEYYGGNIPWLKTGDLTDGIVTETPESISKLALEKTSVRLNPIGSVLMAMYGATIGKLGILGIQATTNQACCACIPYSGVYNKYLFYYLRAYRRSFVKMGEGGAQPNISKEKIVNTLFALPPLAEQKRIVAKIEQLLPLCERLK